MKNSSINIRLNEFSAITKGEQKSEISDIIETLRTEIRGQIIELKTQNIELKSQINNLELQV